MSGTLQPLVVMLIELFVSVLATSIIRLQQIFGTNFSHHDPTWSSVGLNMWSTVESCCAVMGACLPTMRPLITRARAFAAKERSSAKRSNATQSESKIPVKTQGACYHTLSEGTPGKESFEMWNASTPQPTVQRLQATVEIPVTPSRQPPAHIAECRASLDPHRQRPPHPVVRSERYKQEKSQRPLPALPVSRPLSVR